MFRNSGDPGVFIRGELWLRREPPDRPNEVARLVMRATRVNDLYVFTYQETRALLEDRFCQLTADSAPSSQAGGAVPASPRI